MGLHNIVIYRTKRLAVDVDDSVDEEDAIEAVRQAEIDGTFDTSEDWTKEPVDVFSNGTTEENNAGYFVCDGELRWRGR